MVLFLLLSDPSLQLSRDVTFSFVTTRDETNRKPPSDNDPNILLANHIVLTIDQSNTHPTTQVIFKMYLTRSEYDRGVNTFSPEGRLFQVEYAIEAIKLGSTAIGLQTKSGSVLAVEKRLTSSLLEPSSVEKIAEIDVHVGAAMSGLVADARTLVDHARVEAQNHRFTYDEPIGVEALTQGELSEVIHSCIIILSRHRR